MAVYARPVPGIGHGGGQQASIREARGERWPGLGLIECDLMAASPKLTRSRYPGEAATNHRHFSHDLISQRSLAGRARHTAPRRSVTSQKLRAAKVRRRQAMPCDFRVSKNGSVRESELALSHPRCSGDLRGTQRV